MFLPIKDGQSPNSVKGFNQIEGSSMCKKTQKNLLISKLKRFLLAAFDYFDAIPKHEKVNE
jgi:hypothetical protein